MKISVITVTYNSAKTIADTLSSLAAQTHDDIEHVIVDGASSDDTLRIVADHAQPWRHAVSEPDRGIYDAMNKGIGLVSGDVVGFLNSDDFYASPGALTKVAAAFVDPAIDVVYADLCYVAQDDVRQIVRYCRSGPFAPGLFARGWAPPHPTLFVRRKVFAKIGGFDLAYPIAADLELMARLLEVHGLRSHHVPEVLVHMRTGGASNRSLKSVFGQNQEVWRALRKHGLVASPWRFFCSKIVSRGSQFLARPH